MGSTPPHAMPCPSALRPIAPWGRVIATVMLAALLGCVADSSGTGDPVMWTPVSDETGTDDGGIGPGAGPGGEEVETDADCPPGDHGCPCVMDRYCKSGLVCEQSACVPCTDCATCGDATCDEARGESCASCPADCGACPSCGDGICDEELAEDCASCPDDCGACAPCGDGACDPALGEDCFSCMADCGACPPACGDGECSGGETSQTCPGDCPAPPPTDPCADALGGWWCGQSIGGSPGVLYTCSGGATTGTEPCDHGCATCSPGTPDVCKTSAGQTSANACNPAECTADDQRACSANETCVGGECSACGVGTSNCDGAGGCECSGYCGTGGFCCTEANCMFQPQCGIC